MKVGDSNPLGTGIDPDSSEEATQNPHHEHVMKVTLIQVPGAFWIAPVDYQIEPMQEPKKRLYMHVIPLDITYQVLLVFDIPILELFDGIATVYSQNKDKDKIEFTFYWQKSIINNSWSEVSTTDFPSGATFLMTDGDTILPTFHTGRLWQCDSCQASFDNYNKLIQHLKKFKYHQLSQFGVPTNWGIVNNDPPGQANPRRKQMEEALTIPELSLNKFVMDENDMEWENCIARKFCIKNSKKWKSSNLTMDSEMAAIIEEGKPIPEELKYQLSGTWDNYQPCLRRIVTFYQEVHGRPLHYQNFFDYGCISLVNLANPQTFFEKWKSATPEMLKKCLAAHNLLLSLVENAAMGPSGVAAFNRLYDDPKEATTKGPMDRNIFMSNLRDIKAGIKNNQLYSRYAIMAEAKRNHAKQLYNQLTHFEEGKNPKLKEAVAKYMASNFTKESEDDLISASTYFTKESEDDMSYIPLSTAKWINMTEWVVTRLQVFSGGRREASDMKVGEWESRNEESDGSSTIDRSFTKLEGTVETFVHYDKIETWILVAYQVARQNQFPELEKAERHHLQPFFVNSVGKTYIGKKGNTKHLSAWNEITGRHDVPSDFRRTMATWTLSTDLVTRANSAFVCAHSPEIMTRVYADNQEKRKKGILVLKKYQDEELGKQDIGSSLERSKFFNFKLPPHLAEKQRLLRLDAYDRALEKAIRVEQDHHKDQHDENPEKPASTHSRASLLEIVAEERSSGIPVTEEFGFLADILLKKKEGNRKKHVNRAITNKAILNVVDSPRFKEHYGANALAKILVQASSAKIADDVETIEYEVIKKWLDQFGNLGKQGTQLQQLRNWDSFVRLANIAESSETYCLGNLVIENQVRMMQEARQKLECDDETNEARQKLKCDNETNKKKEQNETRKSPRLQTVTKDANQTASENNTPENKNESPSKSPKQKEPHGGNKARKAINFGFDEEENQEDITNEGNIEPPSPQQERTSNTPTWKRTFEQSEENQEDKRNDGQMESSPHQPSSSKTPTQKSPRNKTSEQSLVETPPQIKVHRFSNTKRAPNWTPEEKGLLLDHVLKHMENPTTRPDKAGRIKRDIVVNVLPKVSPDINTKPDESRKVDEILAQYYK